MLGFESSTSKPKIESRLISINTGVVGAFHPLLPLKSHIFLDFNAVIVNIDSLSPELQSSCIERIKENVKTLKSYLEENINEKEHIPEIPETGMAVLRQQFVLVEAIEKWIASLKIGCDEK